MARVGPCILHADTTGALSTRTITMETGQATQEAGLRDPAHAAAFADAHQIELQAVPSDGIYSGQGHLTLSTVTDQLVVDHRLVEIISTAPNQQLAPNATQTTYMYAPPQANAL